MSAGTALIPDIAGGILRMEVKGVGVAGTSAYNFSKGLSEGQQMLGESGPKIDGSMEVGRGKGWRVDVENPAPGERPGQVHYQDYKDNKYIYDPANNMFRNFKTREYISRSQNKQLLSNKEIMHAINKGVKILNDK